MTSQKIYSKLAGQLTIFDYLIDWLANRTLITRLHSIFPQHCSLIDRSALRMNHGILVKVVVVFFGLLLHLLQRAWRNEARDCRKKVNRLMTKAAEQYPRELCLSLPLPVSSHVILGKSLKPKFSQVGMNYHVLHFLNAKIHTLGFDLWYSWAFSAATEVTWSDFTVKPLWTWNAA